MQSISRDNFPIANKRNPFNETISRLHARKLCPPPPYCRAEKFGRTARSAQPRQQQERALPRRGAPPPVKGIPPRELAATATATNKRTYKHTHARTLASLSHLHTFQKRIARVHPSFVAPTCADKFFGRSGNIPQSSHGEEVKSREETFMELAIILMSEKEGNYWIK